MAATLREDGDGHLLLGLDSGLSVVDPEALGAITEAPEPSLAKAIWDQAELVDDDPGHVASGPWTLELLFCSSWFIDERSLLYRHRLEGFDRDWSKPRPRNQATARYTGLPAGQYTLYAQVFTPLFGWGPQAELYSFKVDPPWWSKTGMLVFWAALAIAVGFSLIQWRTASLRSRAMELQETVEQRTAELRVANEELEKLVSQDSLTGLMNRRALWSEAERFRAISVRQNLVFGLIVFDLDHFKKINDTLGHPVGDAVLKHVGRVATSILRGGEVLARWGGEEFAVLLAPAAEPPDLMAASERIRKALIDQPMVLEGGGTLDITCSLGASHWSDPECDFELLLHHAD